MGMLVGLAIYSLGVAGLFLARFAAQQPSSTSELAMMPTWQLMLVPILSLPIGVGLGLLAFLLGPDI